MEVQLLLGIHSKTQESRYSISSGPQLGTRDEIEGQSTLGHMGQHLPSGINGTDTVHNGMAQRTRSHLSLGLHNGQQLSEGVYFSSSIEQFGDAQRTVEHGASQSLDGPKLEASQVAFIPAPILGYHFPSLQQKIPSQ